MKRDTKAIGAGDENTVLKKSEMFGHWAESFYVCANDRKFPSSVENDAKNNFSPVLHIQRPERTTWMRAVWRPSPVRRRERDSTTGKDQDLFKLQCCQLGDI